MSAERLKRKKLEPVIFFMSGKEKDDGIYRHGLIKPVTTKIKVIRNKSDHFVKFPTTIPRHKPTLSYLVYKTPFSNKINPKEIFKRNTSSNYFTPSTIKTKPKKLPFNPLGLDTNFGININKKKFFSRIKTKTNRFEIVKSEENSSISLKKREIQSSLYTTSKKFEKFKQKMKILDYEKISIEGWSTNYIDAQ
jgi:hypothetical protein